MTIRTSQAGLAIAVLPGGAIIFTGVALVRVGELHGDGPDAVRCVSGQPDEVDPPAREQRPDATVSA